jgi:hypothetical protein
MHIEAAEGERVGEGRRRDVDIEAAGDLGEVAMLRIAPIALAIRPDVALAAAVQVVELEVELAGTPAGIAFDLVAQAEGLQGRDAQDLAASDDMIALERQAQMLHALALPGLPEDAPLLGHAGWLASPVMSEESLRLGQQDG